MLDYFGNVIDFPTFGCYAGCVKDYCFLFGKEVPLVLYNSVAILTLFVCIMALFKLWSMFRKPTP